jgi:hypothetical protein
MDIHGDHFFSCTKSSKATLHSRVHDSMLLMLSHLASLLNSPALPPMYLVKHLALFQSLPLFARPMLPFGLFRPQGQLVPTRRIQRHNLQTAATIPRVLRPTSRLCFDFAFF